MTEEAEVDKQQRINYIRNLYAFDLFVQHRFEESLRIFAELRTGGFWMSQLSVNKSLFRDCLDEYLCHTSEIMLMHQEKLLTVLLVQRVKDLLKIDFILVDQQIND